MIWNFLLKLLLDTNSKTLDFCLLIFLKIMKFSPNSISRYSLLSIIKEVWLNETDTVSTDPRNKSSTKVHTCQWTKHTASKESFYHTSSNIHVIVNYSDNSSDSHHISRYACTNKILGQFTFHCSRHPAFFMIFRLQKFLKPREVQGKT